MNTTPLIDVMLVLLIMFVITIPVATHSVDVDLPGDECVACPAPDALKNLVTIGSDDLVRWNGTTVNQRQLAGLLAQTRAMPVEPELQFQPDANAAYQLSAETLATIKASGVTRFGFVGNERYRYFAAR
jgi:biopolymer transport protein ExbD